MVPVELDDRQARIGTLTLPFDRVRLRLLWRTEGDVARGHAHVLCARDDAIDFVGLEHGVIDQAGMLELLDIVDRRLAADKLRTWTPWSPPEGGTSVTGDVGALAELLRGRRLRVLDAATGLPPVTWRPPPEPFLRAPVAAWARHLLGIDWPERWEAPVLRGRFLAVSRGPRLAFAGCHYGSKHAGAGQDRTAAVFLSEDGGRAWSELPWRLSRRQAGSSAGRWCWPPEQLLAVRLEPDLAVDWDDPWIDWEPGDEWRAVWEGERWRMEKR